MKESLVALMLACIVGSGLAELTDKRAMTLLNRYGFSDGEPSTDSDIKRAVEDFQDFYSLEQTDFNVIFSLYSNNSIFSSFSFLFFLTIQWWSDVSALTFEYTADPANADIAISFVSGDHGDGLPFDGTDLAHAFLPVDLLGPIAGDVHLNDAIHWVSFDDGFLFVILHELGHSLGLSHSQDTNSLMYAYYNEQPLQLDDIAGIRALYGVKCGAPPEGFNTESVLIDEGSPGEEYTYTCMAGYTANHLDLLVVCEQNNTAITASWSPGAPNCTTEIPTTPTTTQMTPTMMPSTTPMTPSPPDGPTTKQMTTTTQPTTTPMATPTPPSMLAPMSKLRYDTIPITGYDTKLVYVCTFETRTKYKQ
ncbi:matrilysin-like [Strongylocentrotus purpuratus]|uniref:Sushi domain-containing protein n=1 Tax=Strongylocentrotus purpuratus TaxID=7668 RepID=A0A7M7SW81_STRPU|nr:matrilysin-like [Strongylocentrotus purpuratus]